MRFHDEKIFRRDERQLFPVDIQYPDKWSSLIFIIKIVYNTRFSSRTHIFQCFL